MLLPRTFRAGKVFGDRLVSTRGLHGRTTPALILPMLILLVAMALTGSSAVTSAAAPEVDESSSLRLTSTGLTESPLKGFARLRLRMSALAGVSFRATVQVEGDGLIENRVYAMWLSNPNGNTLLVDTARADEECEVDPAGGTDCEVILNLRVRLTQAPFNITTLGGLTVDIREHSIGTQVTTTVLMTGTVTTSNLRSFIMTVRPPNVGTNVGNPFGDAPDFAAIRSSGRPPVIGRNIGSPFDRAEDEDDERRLEEEEEEQGSG